MRLKKNIFSSLKTKKNKFGKLGKKIFPTKSIKQNRKLKQSEYNAQRKLIHLKLKVATEKS